MARRSQSNTKSRNALDAKPTLTLPALHSSQHGVKSSARRFNVLNCGRRWGKDVLCINLFIEGAQSGKPCGWYQPTYKSLLEVWRAVKRYTKPAQVSVSEQDKRIELVGGGVLEFWSLDGDPESSRGRRYKRVIVNEAAKARHLQLAWETTIIQTLLDFRGDAWFPSTPRGKDYFYGLWRKGQAGDENYTADWMSWTRPTSSNPRWTAEEIQTLRESVPATRARQEFDAEFVEREGQFFAEFQPDTEYTDWDERLGQFVTRREAWHVTSKLPDIKPWWQFWGAMDYGTSHSSPTWCFLLFCCDPMTGDVWVLDERYEAGLTDDDQAQCMLECLERWRLAKPQNPANRRGKWEVSRTNYTDSRGNVVSGGFQVIPIDYAGTYPPEGQRRTIQGKYPAEIYHERGLPVARADKNRKAGWSTCKRYFHGQRVEKRADGDDYAVPVLRIYLSPERQAIANEEGSRFGMGGFSYWPKRYSHGGCPHLVRTLPTLNEDPRDQEDIDETPENAPPPEDHPADTLRMGLHTRPKGNEPPPQPTARPVWQFDTTPTVPQQIR